MNQSLSQILLIFIVAVSGTCTVLSFTFESSIWWTWMSRTFLQVLPCIIFTVATFVVWKGTKETKNNFTIAVVSCFLSLFLGEAMLASIGNIDWVFAGRDLRTQLDVVRDRREKGLQSFPALNPTLFLREPLNFRGVPIIPLGGISSVDTVFCNETGSYVTYKSDERGFRNEPGVWEAPVRPVVLLGDSFTQGFCQEKEKYYASILAGKLSQTVINLGMNGNGPLLALAGFREYGANLNPERVIWFFYEGNDIEDFSQRVTHPLIQSYLISDKFTHNFWSHASSLDKAMRGFVEDVIATKGASLGHYGSMVYETSLVKEVLTLYNIRHLVGLYDLFVEWPLVRLNTEHSTEFLRESLFSTVKQLRDEIVMSGARMQVVYIPAHRTFSHGTEHPWKERVLEIFKNLEIEYLDFTVVMARQSDPLSLYTYRRDGHFTEEGNELLAKTVFDSWFRPQGEGENE